MIAEIGHAALWLAAALALLQFIAPTLGLRSAGHAGWVRFTAPAATAQGLLTLIAFAALTWCFVASDFSVKLVVAHSHSLKPLLYKITGVWANHEGSMLLWVTVLAVAGTAVALLGSIDARFRARVLSVQALIALGFYVFLLSVSNPFARIAPAAAEGRGLNPLLQDPGLAFHPPTLYLGYVGLSVAFAFAVAALVDRRVTPAWAKIVRPWVLAAWGALTLGICLGSWWAYYELGWGGFWFWDPVENASLMPWLAATALLHSVSVLAARDALRNWTILLAVLAFSLSMIGTFIVRSGIITSVHSFAVDPARGVFLLALLGLYVGGALALYASRATTVEVGEGFAAVSREGSLVVNNLLLSAALGVVFLGTLYPLALEAATGAKISVGAPYFNTTAAPFALLLVALMGVGPLLAWKRANPDRLAARLAVPALAAAGAAIVALSIAQVREVIAVLGFGLAAWALVASLIPLGRRSLHRIPAATWAMVVAHIGVAIALFGITASTSLRQEALVAMRIGDSLHIAGFAVRLAAVEPVAGPNYTAVEARIAVTRNGHPVTTLAPQSRTYTSPPMETTEAGIAMLPAGDLYTVIGKPDGSGRWQVRAYWHPFVWAIWAGGTLMALGGAIGVFGKRRARAARPHSATPPTLAPQPAE